MSAGRDHAAVVLSYHRVGPPPPGSWETWFSIDEETFLGQLRDLVDHGWEPVGVDAFVAGLEDPGHLPRRAALLTFDDAFRTLGGTARACLRRLGYPAAVFVPTGHIGGSNEWDGDTQPQESICDWDDLRELERDGLSVQSHGVSHRRFSLLAGDEQVQELVESKRAIEEELGKHVELFAYPYGDDGTDADRMDAAVAGAGYRAAFLYDGASFRLPASDRFRLPRIPMGPDTDLGAELARAA